MQKGIYAALGFGAGVLIGWAVTADIYDKKGKEERFAYAELLTDKTEHIWALQDRLDNPFIEDIDTIPGQISFKPPVASEEVEELMATPIDVAEETVEETEEETRTNLKAIIERYTSDPDAQADYAEMINSTIDTENSSPFVISRDQYAYDDEGQSYEKNTLTYYPRERVLLDDQDEPIDHIPGAVGLRNLARFGDESGDPNVVFVRNHKLQTDFEVVREDENPLPLHVKYGMEKEEFRANKAAGLIKLRPEDE